MYLIVSEHVYIFTCLCTTFKLYLIYIPVHLLFLLLLKLNYISFVFKATFCTFFILYFLLSTINK